MDVNIDRVRTVDLIAVPIAMLGYATPLVAAVAMSTSSLIVVDQCLAAAGSRIHEARRKQCIAHRLAAGRGWSMNTLAYLIPIALFLGGLGPAAFLWALKNDQYEDLDGAAWRVLDDGDGRPEKD